MGIVLFMISLALSLVFSGLAGYFAGKIMHANFSVLKSVIIGIIGGYVGRALFALIGLGATGLIGSTLIAIAGACVCIWLARKFLK